MSERRETIVVTVPAGSIKPDGFGKFRDYVLESLQRGGIVLDGAPESVFSQVSLLHSVGLAAPDTVELCWELNKCGFSLPLDRLSIEDCAQALYDAVKA